MKNLKRALYGWVGSDPQTYRTCFYNYGGSINVHPDVFEFITAQTGQKVSYYHQEKQGEVIAAYALIDNHTLGVKNWYDYPLSYDEVLLPIAPGCKVLFPENSNKLSCLNRDNIVNANFSLGRKKRVCIAKGDYSSKTEKNRRNEYNRFIRAGGHYYDLNQFSPEQLADYYIQLFESRFEGTVHCFSRSHLIDILTHLNGLIFGHILFVNEEPCAIDLIFMAETKDQVYFDIPNGGVNRKFSHLSPGSILMWMNINAARKYCEISGKTMRLCIGALDENWNYKLRWANAHATGRTFL
ncbi:hypothetical protein CYR32_10215 [Chimaeribacter coloradensis]|uniref:GNAT family N-acetyltransferase n=1 Tax=Chimaeribacter coloradensis TaxID=2060068 RepID=A0A2N5E3Y7_9GAMM|nr:GNAT family N-acetyltransferase [Chimaeribacter coloradensis]PLR35559.1 hypothetical protein CYR32_10215 [Chimaeribacter coloradensis]